LFLYVVSSTAESLFDAMLGAKCTGEFICHHRLGHIEKRRPGWSGAFLIK
jgi:hypothetical protein